MLKRTFLVALGASLLLIGVPSVASAHHAKRHAACRASTHKRHAKCAHARAHVLSFGPNLGAPAGSAGSSPSTPATPSPTETAGTVTKYAAPMLTITLNDKTEVTGKVTEDTRIECESKAPAGEGEQGGDDGGSEGSGEAGAGLGGHGDSAVARSANAGDDDGEGNDQGDDEGNTQPCTTSALTPGALVRSAELLLTNEGPIWEKVLLIS
jgi:hypothetical protein